MSAFFQEGMKKAKLGQDRLVGRIREDATPKDEFDAVITQELYMRLRGEDLLSQFPAYDPCDPCSDELYGHPPLTEYDLSCIELAQKAKSESFRRFLRLSAQKKGSLYDKQECPLPKKIVHDLVREYLDYKVKNLKPGSIPQYNQAMDLFCRALELPSSPLATSDLNASHFSKVRDFIENDNPTRAKKTNTALSTVIKNWVEWCNSKGFEIEKKLVRPLNKITGKESKDRRDFSSEELKLFFESSLFLGSRKEKASMYWIPTIAIFSGMRQAEIGQLHLEDIKEIDGNHFFDLNTKNGKQLKTKTSVRQMAIHPKLIELGFLDFLQRMKNLKSVTLFPYETRNKKGEFSDFSKRINRRLKQIPGLESRVFHEFRHTSTTTMFDNGAQEMNVSAVNGHRSKSTSESVQNYSHNKKAKTNIETINAISYPDISFVKFDPDRYMLIE